MGLNLLVSLVMFLLFGAELLWEGGDAVTS